MWVSALKKCKAISFVLCAKHSMPQPIATYQAEKKTKSENKMAKTLQAFGWSSTGSMETKTQPWDSFLSTCKS